MYAIVLVVFSTVLLCPPSGGAALPLSPCSNGGAMSATQDEDIDAFMAEVLKKRRRNWDQQYNYIFSERETLEFGGDMQSAPVQGFTSEYVWYVRDGYLVRSPVSVNGAPVPEDERRKREDEWIERARKGKKSGSGIDRDKFFGFKFDKGKFYYAGRREFEGRQVVMVEYYPWGEIVDESGEEDESEREIEENLEKSMQITMYIIPEEHQIVRMSLDNIGFDFLPGKWLVRVGEIRASMTMHEPYDGAWLPKEMVAYGSVATAYGDLTVRYHRRFYDYLESEVKVQYRFPPREEDR